MQYFNLLIDAVYELLILLNAASMDIVAQLWIFCFFAVVEFICICEWLILSCFRNRKCIDAVNALVVF